MTFGPWTAKNGSFHTCTAPRFGGFLLADRTCSGVRGRVVGGVFAQLCEVAFIVGEEGRSEMLFEAGKNGWLLKKWLVPWFC